MNSTPLQHLTGEEIELWAQGLLSTARTFHLTECSLCRSEAEHERKVVLEEQVPLDSDKVKALRERLFGNWEMNWVGFNYARDFVLPGQKEGPIGFLMYPYAETPDGSMDSLDPTHFTYTIAASEIT